MIEQLGEYDSACYVCGVCILRKLDSITSKLLLTCKSRAEAEAIFEKWKTGVLTNENQPV